MFRVMKLRLCIALNVYSIGNEMQFYFRHDVFHILNLAHARRERQKPLSFMASSIHCEESS